MKIKTSDLKTLIKIYGGNTRVIDILKMLNKKNNY